MKFYEVFYLLFEQEMTSWIIKADFVPSKRATFPTNIKNVIHNFAE